MRGPRKERCRELYERWVKGEYLKDLVEDLSEEFDVKKKTIYRDWEERHDWLDEVFEADIDDGETALLEILTDRQIIASELWKLYKTTDNQNVKLGALKQLNKKTNTLFDDLQEAGIIDKTADELEGKLEININKEVVSSDYKPEEDQDD